MTIEIIHGDSTKDICSKLKPNSIDCIVTSPPYYKLRDYNVDGQIGEEQTVYDYLDKLDRVWEGCSNVLKTDGTMFVVVGDRWLYGNMELIPYRIAESMKHYGFIIRNMIIWNKTNPVPLGGKCRNFVPCYELVIFATKSMDYYFDCDSVKEPAKHPTMAACKFGGNKYSGVSKTYSGHTYTGVEYRRKRNVWDIATQPFKGAHFACFPEKLVEICIKSGCKPDGTVFDPFSGAGTTGLVCKKLGMNYIGMELNNDYITLSKERIGI